jgi:transcriptional regulator with XRE-family HTH domain
MAGKIGPDDIAAVRRFVHMSQERFAQAMHISVDLLRDWEEGRRKPRRGPAIVFLQIAARDPSVIRGLVKPIDESVAIVGATTTPATSRSGATGTKNKNVRPRKRRRPQDSVV